MITFTSDLDLLSLAAVLLPAPALKLRASTAAFAPGFTAITQAGEAVGGLDPGIDFGICVLGPGDTRAESDAKESAWILLHGNARVSFGDQHCRVTRQNLFQEPPSALHVGPDTPVTITAEGEGSEWAVVRVSNEHPLQARLFLPADLKPEFRGAGLVQGACLRNVRLVFGLQERPRSNLVIGEVVNYPGRWSSYPPHHHVQPEIYHYRFTHPAGYGHAELGEQVLKVRANDTVVIPPGLDHAQVSAPGYGMYYLWIIRHLPGEPYTGFTFTAEHEWTLDPAQQGWEPPASLPPLS